jgi:hypothetical protein
MRTTCTFFSILAILSVWAASPASAKDDPLEFIHLMQREGYADVAIDYLNQLKADPNAPKEVGDVWDLEMAKSKKQAVADGQAYNDAQAKQWLDESKALIEKFVKDNPDRPEAIQEAAKWLEDKGREAQYDVQKAGFATDPAEKKKLLAEARKLFAEIRPKFVDALKSSIKLRDSLPPKSARMNAKTLARHETITFMVGENRLMVAMIDFYLAYTEEASSQRGAALTKCAKEFDDIFQDFRDVFLGSRAHFWQGRTILELGQFQEARDILEEVAARDPRNIEDVGDTKNPIAARAMAKKKTGLEDFFADVQQYYLQSLFKVNKKDYMEEVKTWRLKHKPNSENCAGYQALTMDYVKHCLEFAKTAKDPAIYKKAALQLLNEMAKIPSPYQEAAIKLRGELNPNSKQEMGFDEAVINGDSAVEKQKWKEAIEAYEKALAVAGPKIEKERLAAVKDVMIGCYHRLAAQYYHENKVSEALETANKGFAPEFRQAKTAPALAVYLLNVASYQYQLAADDTEEHKTAKSKLLETLTTAAKDIIKFWPSQEEADAARIVLMRLAQAQGNMSEADRILNEINPGSKEYPNALIEIGYLHWSKYLDAKKKGESDKNAVARRDDDRKQAVTFVEKAVEAMNTNRQGPMPEALRKARMFLAKIYSEGEDFKHAASLYKPLIDDIAKDTSKPFDEVAFLQILYGAGTAFLKLGDMDNAAYLGTKFIALGPDQAQINDAILNFALSLEQIRKEALAESDSADAAVQAAAKAKAASLTELEETMLVDLAKREKLSCRSMVSMVRTASNLKTDGGNKTAGELIEKIFELGNQKQEFDEELKRLKAAAFLNSLGAKLQADGGHYEKAVERIKALLDQYPNALAPMVTEAQIYTDWAGKDSTKYGDAILKWDSLRKKLERIKPQGGSKQVDPKYEVIVNEAECFYRMYLKTNNKPDAKKGYDLLLPYLNLDPNIRTPRDEYRETSIRYYQVAGKIADKLSIQRPVRPKVKPAPSK